MADPIKLGQLLPPDENRRDAVHIAIAPATAADTLKPGQAVGFMSDNSTRLLGITAETIGIVDPYLTADVLPGQRFWLFLYPETITSLRHVWTHPAFQQRSSAVLPKGTNG